MPVKRKFAVPSITQPAFSTYLQIRFKLAGEEQPWQDSQYIAKELGQKVERNGVSLKSVNTIGTTINGVIAVMNYSYKKHVNI